MLRITVRGVSAPSGTAQHSLAWCLISLPGINGVVVPALRRSWHLLLALLWPPGKGIWGGLRGRGDRVIHQPRRFWVIWQAGRIATPSSWTAGTGLQPPEGVKGNGTLEGTPESQGTQDTCPVMLLSPPKATVPLGTGSALRDDADRWQ